MLVVFPRDTEEHKPRLLIEPKKPDVNLPRRRYTSRLDPGHDGLILDALVHLKLSNFGVSLVPLPFS